MEHNFWKYLDTVSNTVGRASRIGNGRIRVTIALIILAAMLLYPFWSM